MIRKVAMIALIVSIVVAITSCSKDDTTGPRDKVKPSVSFVSPNPFNETTRYGIVDITVEAADDAGIDRVELYVNGSMTSSDSSAPYSFEWDMSSLSDGSSNSVYARAVDGNGNAEKTETVSVTKGVTAFPVAALTSPSDGKTAMQGDILTFTGSGNDTEDGALSDSNLTWISNLQGTFAQGTSSDYRGLVIGDHEITLMVTDSNGMTNTASVNVTVTENNLSYAVIGPGTYSIGEPVFPSRKITISGFDDPPRYLYVSKTEMTVKQYLELFVALYLKVDAAKGEANAGKEITKLNKSLYDPAKDVGYFPRLYEYETLVPVKAQFENYPACFIPYKNAVRLCNIISEQDNLEPAYLLLSSKFVPLEGKDVLSLTKIKYVQLVEGADGWRLPTESEWEITARAGYVGKKYPWGDGGPGGYCNSMVDPSPPDALDFFQGRGICPVDSYEPNRYGLYNMVGNVSEMCTDAYGVTLLSGVDPYRQTQEKTPRYVTKGGSWYGFKNDVQIAMRSISLPLVEKDFDSIDSGIGIRLVRNPK